MKYSEKKAIDAISKMIVEYKDLEGVEFEFRLGRMNGRKFDSNIGQEFFQKIANTLTSNTSWNAQEMLHTTEYSKKKSNVRQILDEKTDTETFIEKKRIKDITYTVDGMKLDFRFSVSQEIPLTNQETMEDCDFVREKKRTSRHHKNWKFETTQVEGGDIDPDDENQVRYEVELEVKDPKDIKSGTSYATWFAHSGILKTMDMLKMCN